MHDNTQRFLLLFVLFLASVPGCDRAQPLNPEVPIEKRILWPIEDVDDRASSPRELQLVKKVFAPGCEPSDEALPRYAAYHYEAKQPVQNGDSATVVVVIKDAQSGEVRGELKWSLKKTNDAWKLTDAPLPEK